MGTQDLIAISVVALTIGLVVWRRVRRPKFNFQRDTHCGCATPATGAGAGSSIVFHARKGERPQVRMKMK